MQRIGLIGGITWAASAEYYRRLNLGVRHRLGGHHSADMVLRSLDLDPLLQQAADIEANSGAMAAAARDLLNAGARILAVASFTGHRYAAPLARMPAPLVDLGQALGERLRATGHRRIAVWATSHALGDDLLIDGLARRSGADLVLPPPPLRAGLDRIIFEELADRGPAPESVDWLRRLLATATGDGAEALLLATTDLSPVAALLGSAVPVLDATGIHCAAILDAALAPPSGDRP